MSRVAFRGIFAAVIFTALVRQAAIAQTETATLVGTVRDTSGAAVPEAKVTVVNTQTQFRSETVTSSEGDYYVPYLAPGNYQITVEKAGFKRYVHDAVMIRTGETPRVDVPMEVGAVTESVEVSATNPLLDTDTTIVGQIMENSTFVNIQVPQGEVVRFLGDFPTVEYSGTGGDWHVAGLRTRMIGYTIDGMTAKTPGTNVLNDTDNVLLPNAEALQEISVSSAGMSAEYGHSAGGAMSLVFKSGTNSLHGSLDERYVWKQLVNRDWFTLTPLTNIPLYYNWFNGAISGPVVIPKLYNGKDKTFFLFAFGSIMQSGGQPIVTPNLPTAAMEQGNFDFGPKSLTIYNPYTTTKNAAGTYVSAPFPNNQIPASLLDPVALNFLSHNPFAQPSTPAIITQTGPQSNYVDSPPKHVHRFITDVKIDHQFSSKHKIFGRVSYEVEPVWYKGGSSFQPQISWSLIDPNSQLSPEHNYNAVFSDTYIFGATRFNDFRVGFNRRDFTQTSGTDNTNWSQQLGIPNVSANGFPVFSIPTYGYFGPLGGYHQAGQDWQLQDTFTQVMGKHTFKIGYELQKSEYDSVLQQQPSGTYTFGSLGSEQPFTPNTGNPFADFMLGAVSSAVYTQNLATWLPRWWHNSLFVQDDWKPRRGLTLNLGLRWAYESPFRTKYGQQSEFNPTVADPLTGLMGAITHPTGPLSKGDWNNFQPRLGLAWNFRPKWVFRSSFGIMTQDLTVSGINQNFNEYQGTANVQQLPGVGLPAFYLKNGPPTFSYPIQSNGTASFVGSNYSARNADWIDPNIRAPYVMMWSAGLQYEFASNWLAEFMYNGNASVGLLEGWNINQIPLNISTDPTQLTKIYQSQQNYLPFPQFGAINLYSNFGHSTYHAGTARVEKRYAHGLTLHVIYSYAKALDDCDTDGICTGVDYYNRRLEKGRAAFSIKHHFENIMNYELPFGKGRPFMNRGGILNAALGGWTIASTWEVESGNPFSVTIAGGPNQYLPGGGVQRPNILTPNSQAQVSNWSAGANRFPQTAQKPYLLFNDFAYPANFTVGNLGRNTFTGPPMNWLQLGLSKTWAVRERFKVTVRMEGNNWPFKQPELLVPYSIYNINNPLMLGTFSTLRNPFAEPGQSRPHIVLGGRIEF